MKRLLFILSALCLTSTTAMLMAVPSPALVGAEAANPQSPTVTFFCTNKPDGNFNMTASVNG